MVRVSVFDAARKKLYYSRRFELESTPLTSVGDVFELDIESNVATPLLEKCFGYVAVPSEGSGVRLVILRQQAEDDTQHGVLTVITEAGDHVEFDGVVFDFNTIVAWADQIAFLRDGASGVRELWAGSLTAPAKLSGELDVHDWAWLGLNRFAIAASAPSSDSIAIYRIEPGTDTPALEVRANIKTADWAGPDPAPPLSSEGLKSMRGLTVGGQHVNTLAGGCWSESEKNAWGAADQRCYVLYRRSMTDGTVRPFVYDPHRKRETALPDMPPTDATVYAAAEFSMWAFNGRHAPRLAGSAPLVAWLPGRPPVETRAPRPLLIWNAKTGHLQTCSISGRWPLYFWREDGRAVAISAGSGLTVATDDAAECQKIDSMGGAYSALFSADGNRIFWSGYDGIWEADGRGTEPHRVIAGAKLSLLAWLGTSRILANRFATSSGSQGLIYLDLDEPTPVEHVLGEQVFGVIRMLSPRQLITGTAQNPDDMTGTLTFIDIDQHSAESMGNGVLSWTFGWPGAQDATSFPFAYVKMGRFPSDQDGIWIGAVSSNRIDGAP